MSRIAARWGDNDRYFGPFTFSRDKRRDHIAVMVSSTDDEDRACTLRLSALGFTFLSVLPKWMVKPERRWVDTSRYEWSRPGGGYTAVTRREFGFYVSDGHFVIRHGRQTHDSSTEQSWSCFLPWTQWRHVRHSLYALDGCLFADLPRNARRNSPERTEEKRLTEACPTASFCFLDFDGQALVATTKIEEREWLLGTRWCKWLSLFAPAKVSRSLDIRFSGETGRRKGSWKGGTIGHSIEMKPGELHEAAFRRYCAEHDMTFLTRAALEQG